MPSNTKYTVMNGETEVVTKSKKAQAIAAADAFADENRGSTVTVVTGAGTEVHSVTRKPKGTHAAPWTRVDASDKIELQAPAGYEISYTRVRIPAIVCRALDRTGLVVVTPEETFEVKDTKEARELTNRLGTAAKEARLQAREEAKAAAAQAREEAKAAKADADSAA